jgi:hypothetical protein
MTACRWSWRFLLPQVGQVSTWSVVPIMCNYPTEGVKKFTVTNFVTSISSVRSGSVIYFIGNFFRWPLNAFHELGYRS